MGAWEERLLIEFCCVAAVVPRRLIEFAYYVQVFVGAVEHTRNFLSFFLFKTLFCSFLFISSRVGKMRIFFKENYLNNQRKNYRK